MNKSRRMDWTSWLVGCWYVPPPSTVGVGRCMHTRAYVPLRCVLVAYRIFGPQDTRFSRIVFFFAIWKRGKVTCPRSSRLQLGRSRCIPRRPRVVFLMEHWPF